MALSTKVLSAAATTTLLARSGTLEAVNFGKAGSADCTVDVYDNPSAGSGTKLFSAGGTVNSSFALGIKDGVTASTGLTVVIAGTTPPVVSFSFQ